jgi:multidrug efflux pump subunit AcrB
LKTLQAKALKVPGVQNVTISTGRGFLSGNGSNNGLAFVKLKPFEERKKTDRLLKILPKNYSEFQDLFLMQKLYSSSRQVYPVW